MPENVGNGTHLRFKLNKYKGDFFAIARAHERPVRLTFPYTGISDSVEQTYVQV